MVVSIILAIVFFYSFLVNYNNKLPLIGKIPFWDKNKTFDISMVLRWLILITAIVSVYTAVKNYQIIEKNAPYDKEALNAEAMEIIGTILLVIAAFIGLEVISHRGRFEDLFEDIA